MTRNNKVKLEVERKFVPMADCPKTQQQYPYSRERQMAERDALCPSVVAQNFPWAKGESILAFPFLEWSMRMTCPSFHSIIFWILIDVQSSALCERHSFVWSLFCGNEEFLLFWGCTWLHGGQNSLAFPFFELSRRFTCPSFHSIIWPILKDVHNTTLCERHQCVWSIIGAGIGTSSILRM